MVSARLVIMCDEPDGPNTPSVQPAASCGSVYFKPDVSRTKKAKVVLMMGGEK